MAKLVRSNKFPLLLIGLVLLMSVLVLAQTRTTSGNVYQVNRQSQWEQWSFPVGTLEIGRDGSVKPAKFRQRHNAALNAGEFLHELHGGQSVWGGAWKAGTNQREADLIIDGDTETYWQPDPDAPLDDWWIEIDLGRATLVSEIRLRFPDREGARPLQEFRVFGSDGHRVTSRDNIFSFHLIGGTTKPINETEISYNVEPIVREARRVRGTIEPLQDQSEATSQVDNTYDLLQYIRILADAKTPDAALAEVEVYTPGENIALQTLARGGTLLERSGRGFVSNMADGDANTDWGARRERGQEAIAWEWDLGALFWVDRIVMRTSDFLIRTLTYGSNLPEIRTHRLSSSDGSRTLTGAVDYDQLFESEDAAFLGAGSDFPGQLNYSFSPRPIRFISAEWEGTDASSFQNQSGFLVETVVLPVGYVAQVEIGSDFIDLGDIAGDNRSKVIKSLEWQADLPPGARILARTRTGDTLQENFRYFRKDGTEVTAEQYDQMPKALRGGTESEIGIGEDWSEWSNFYQESGERFRSPSPRRFIQVLLTLSSDRPTTAPTIHGLTIHFANAFLSGVSGEIQPRFAEPGVAQNFTYRVMPQFSVRDTGFDRIMVRTPGPADPDSLSLTVGGDQIDVESVSISADSIVIELPQTVRRDQVELNFRLTPTDNATLFEAFIGQRRTADLWQPIDPANRAATTVYLPNVAGKDQLITNLSAPPIFTPNGDGIGDRADIRFHVLKVNTPGQVEIYTLAGQLVRQLEGQPQEDQSYLYSWTGIDQNDTLVPPGVYLCRVSVDAQSGEQNLHRIISVAY